MTICRPLCCRAQERNALQNLIRAIQTRDRETACIRIPRSLDGRMQGTLDAKELITVGGPTNRDPYFCRF